jgi:HD superfamily phosphodiesterase
MIPNLEKIIRNIEDKWLKPLFDSCTQQFVNIHLPSHDQWHHLRVWKYAKMLLRHAVKHNIVISETDIERLIIAVFFHDQGMSQTLAKDHGRISRSLCKEYFEKSPLEAPVFTEKALQAIEDHDKKDYLTQHESLNTFDLQQFLNLADDLDALGTMGAYRYLEIYLLRKINIQDLPEAILMNLVVRFKHFVSLFNNDKMFIKHQNQRFLAAHNYFKDLGFQLKQVGYKPDLYIGPIGVFNYIKNEIIEKKQAPLIVCDLVLEQTQDFYSNHFFERLQKELKSDHDY